MRNYLLAFFTLFLLQNSGFGQKVTKVVGIVIDAETKEPLPFVNVGFKGTSVGVSTDLDGKYVVETRFPSDTIFASFVGYDEQYVRITKDQKNEVNFALSNGGIQFQTVDIVAKKEKYSKKNNPALDLSRKVLSNKYRNSLKGQDFYKYDKEEKVRLDLNNITEEFKETPIIRNFEFFWDYVDTSEVNGKTYLPLFIREVLGTVYYKKDGDVLKEHRLASRYTDLEESFDPQTVNDALDALYQDVDIYESKITLMEKTFVSPLAPQGDDFYRYYILDTTYVNGKEAINLAFIPAVKGNLGFTGSLFISNDGRFTVLKVDMSIIKGININFINDIRIIQEFEPLGDAYIKTKDQLVIDYSIATNGVGLYGSKTVFYENYDFTEQDEKYYGGLEKIIWAEGANDRPEDFWKEQRLKPLEKNEVELYEMVDRLKQDPYYKRTVYIGRLIMTGYAPVGPVSIGPLATFASWNRVEGLNLRLGGETTEDFSTKLRLSFYGAYPFKTDVFKYNAGAQYTFNDNYTTNPRHFLMATAERESSFPGQELEFFSPDNIFLSFQRGDPTRMLLNTTYQLNYTHEMNGFSYYLTARHKERLAYGSWDFSKFDLDGNRELVDNITTAEFSMGMRYAPNERFLQGKGKRRQIFNEYPIIRLDYTQGVNGVLGGQYTYSKLNLNLFKQWEFVVWGTTNLYFDAGKVWGDVPYLLQHIPRGNQTYAYQLSSYNMMNFLEFVTDQFVSVQAEHYFNGRFFNRIPWIKRLKLREVVSFKALYGSLSDQHNPNLRPTDIQFPVDANGIPQTYLLGSEPYIEAAIGFTNIFKIFRLDLVKRFNYLDLPNVPSMFGVQGLGLRVRTHIEF